MRLGQVGAVVSDMMRVVVNQSHFLKNKKHSVSAEQAIPRRYANQTLLFLISCQLSRLKFHPLPSQQRGTGPADNVHLRSIRNSGTQPVNPHLLRKVRRIIGRMEPGCSCRNPASYVFTSAAMLEQIVSQILEVSEQSPHQPVAPSLKHGRLCPRYAHNRGNNGRDLHGTVQ